MIQYENVLDYKLVCKRFNKILTSEAFISTKTKIIFKSIGSKQRDKYLSGLDIPKPRCLDCNLRHISQNENSFKCNLHSHNKTLLFVCRCTIKEVCSCCDKKICFDCLLKSKTCDNCNRPICFDCLKYKDIIINCSSRGCEIVLCYLCFIRGDTNHGCKECDEALM